MLTSTALDCDRDSWLIPHFPVASTVISHGAGVIAPYRSDHALQAPNIPTERRLLQTSGRVPCGQVPGATSPAQLSAPTSVRIRGVHSARPQPACPSWPSRPPRPSCPSRPGIAPSGFDSAPRAPRRGGTGRHHATHRRRPVPLPPATPDAGHAPMRSGTGRGAHSGPTRIRFHHGRHPSNSRCGKGRCVRTPTTVGPLYTCRSGPPAHARARPLTYFHANLLTSNVAVSWHE